jgi:hypothetical protein
VKEFTFPFKTKEEYLQLADAEQVKYARSVVSKIDGLNLPAKVIAKLLEGVYDCLSRSKENGKAELIDNAIYNEFGNKYAYYGGGNDFTARTKKNISFLIVSYPKITAELLEDKQLGKAEVSIIYKYVYDNL